MVRIMQESLTWDRGTSLIEFKLLSDDFEPIPTPIIPSGLIPSAIPSRADIHVFCTTVAGFSLNQTC